VDELETEVMDAGASPAIEMQTRLLSLRPEYRVPAADVRH
jgi:hypothetical protein